MRTITPVLLVLLAAALILLGPPAAGQTPPPFLQADDLAELDRLLSEVQHETAIELASRLRQEAGPRASLDRTALDLFYVKILADYVGFYSWEIGQRARVDTEGDFRSWTIGQIAGEIHNEARTETFSC